MTAGLLIERGLVEIDHAVEQSRPADEFFQRLALGVLLREAVLSASELPDPSSALSNGDWRHCRPGRTLDLERLDDECELVDARCGQLVE